MDQLNPRKFRNQHGYNIPSGFTSLSQLRIFWIRICKLQCFLSAVLTEEVIVAEETTNEDENFFTQFEKMEIN